MEWAWKEDCYDDEEFLMNLFKQYKITCKWDGEECRYWAWKRKNIFTWERLNIVGYPLLRYAEATIKAQRKEEEVVVAYYD